MRTIDKNIPIPRRGFLGGSAGVALLAAFAGEMDGAKAFAATLVTVDKPETAMTLTRVARDIYPHDRIPDLYYQKAVATIDADLAKDPDHMPILSVGVAALDAAARQRYGKPYGVIPAEADRVALLQAMEATPFFQKMRAGLVTALYNQPEVWTLLGYEGSSAEHGGYLHRGFDDLDWLPA